MHQCVPAIQADFDGGRLAPLCGISLPAAEGRDPLAAGCSTEVAVGHHGFPQTATYQDPGGEENKQERRADTWIPPQQKNQEVT